MKTVVPAIVTAIILIASSLFWGFMILVALNGFSEKDGGIGMIVFAILSIAITGGFSWLSGAATRALSEKFNNVSAWLIGTGMVFVNLIAGNIVLFIGLTISIFAAGIAQSL